MRRPLVAGNWKMNGSLASARELAAAIAAGVEEHVGGEIAVCPPFPHLATVGEMLAPSLVALGAQNLYPAADGAFTGEISTDMLTDLGCRFVIVGHSERRALLDESDEFVAHKVAAALDASLVPILCVGESLAEREAGQTEQVVARQLGAALGTVGARMLPATVIAYEPVWAIGTGKTASPDQAQTVHAYIRALLARAAPEAADATRILYGGSVKADNAASLFSMPDIDGGLIGGAALAADSFLAICKASLKS